MYTKVAGSKDWKKTVCGPDWEGSSKSGSGRYSDFSTPDYSDGWTWKRPVTKVKWSKVVAESQTGGEDLSNMTYSVQLSCGLYLHPWPIWQILRMTWWLWDHKWSLMTDNLDPTPVGLPTTMSTSIASYHVHIDSDSDHASGQLNRGRALLTSSTSLLNWTAWFHHFHTVAEFQDGMVSMRWSSLYLFWWAAYKCWAEI